MMKLMLGMGVVFAALAAHISVVEKSLLSGYVFMSGLVLTLLYLTLCIVAAGWGAGEIRSAIRDTFSGRPGSDALDLWDFVAQTSGNFAVLMFLIAPMLFMVHYRGLPGPSLAAMTQTAVFLMLPVFFSMAAYAFADLLRNIIRFRLACIRSAGRK